MNSWCIGRRSTPPPPPDHCIAPGYIARPVRHRQQLSVCPSALNVSPGNQPSGSAAAVTSSSSSTPARRGEAPGQVRWRVGGRAAAADDDDDAGPVCGSTRTLAAPSVCLCTGPGRSVRVQSQPQRIHAGATHAAADCHSRDAQIRQ